MSGKCLAIIWDNRQRVYGVRLEKSAAGALVLTQFAEAPESRKSFAERLRSVYDALTESGDELTVLGGAIADLVCVELRLPDLKPQELHEALNYQLRCLLPVEIGDIAYAFRRLPPDEPSRCRLRVEVVPKARLETLFEDIRQSGVRADLLTHPFMAVDPLLADREVFFLDIDPDFSLSRSGDDGLRHINVLELLGERPEEIHLPELVKRNRRKAPDRPVYAAAALLGAYLLSGDLRRNRQTLHLLPDTLRIRRYVGLQRAIIVFLVCNFLLLGGMFWKEFEQSKEQLAALDQEIMTTEALIRKLEKDEAMLKSRHRILDRFCSGVVGEKQLLTFLAKLTECLPNSMWMSSFSNAGGQYTLTINLGKGAPDIMKIIQESLPEYVVKSFLYTPGAEGTAVVNLTLAPQEVTKNGQAEAVPEENANVEAQP